MQETSIAGHDLIPYMGTDAMKNQLLKGVTQRCPTAFLLLVHKNRFDNFLKVVKSIKVAKSFFLPLEYINPAG